jgi:CO dehydrogenase/acetyl-CoA synthase beta subunit
VKVRDSFLELYGEFVTPRGTVVVVREETRSPSDNEKLAIKQLQTMLDKAEELSLVDRTKVEYVTEQERIKSNKTDAQIARYKERTLRDKKLRSQVKRNRSRDWE